MDIKNYLKQAVERYASDLHLLPGMPPLLRINGDLVAIDEDPLHPLRYKS